MLGKINNPTSPCALPVLWWRSQACGGGGVHAQKPAGQRDSIRVFRSWGASKTYPYWISDFPRNSKRAPGYPWTSGFGSFPPQSIMCSINCLLPFSRKRHQWGNFVARIQSLVSPALISCITSGYPLTLSLLGLIICTIQVIATLRAARGLNY